MALNQYSAVGSSAPSVPLFSGGIGHVAARVLAGRLLARGASGSARYLSPRRVSRLAVTAAPRPVQLSLFG